jgi:hypothetical protein
MAASFVLASACVMLGRLNEVVVDQNRAEPAHSHH